MSATKQVENPRIPVLLELFSSMDQFTEPREALDACLMAMRRAYGLRGYIQLTTKNLPPGQYRIIRLLTHDDIDYVDPVVAFENPLDQPIYSGGIIGKVLSSNRPALLQDLDLRNDPVLGEKLAPYRSLIATPLLENPWAFDWAMVLEREPRAVDQSDLEDFVLRANLIGAMLKNLETVRKLGLANARIAREMEAIGRIQRALLPEHVPHIPGVQLAASYNTFDRAGGDLYDLCSLAHVISSDQNDTDPRWGLLIGDVSGHGPAAAVVMAMFHSILHAYPKKPKGPGEVLNHVNRHLCNKSIEASFVTAFLAFYDPNTHELTYARAGHNPPLVKEFPHKGAPISLDEVGEVPLGIFPDIQYSETTIRLKSGQTLILYTDGISEAKTGHGEMFGTEGIANSLVECTGDADCAISHIMHAVRKHQLDVRPDDDQTVVAMKIL